MPDASISFKPSSPFHSGLRPSVANYVALSPLSFLPKAATVHPHRTALVHGEKRQSWDETYRRCRRFASALRARGIERGDTVAIIAPNIPAMYEAHFGVPMAGAVLNTLNTRLDAEAIAFQLDHGEARVLLVDSEFGATIARALELVQDKPFVIDIDDAVFEGAGTRTGEIEYEDFLQEGDPDADWLLPGNEWDPISLSYTSGTTGDPKGVVTNHRGAYLNSLSQIVTWSMPPHPVYLWTLPMFHCNGWCFPWAIAASAGVNICLRKVDPPQVLDLIAEHRVTHMCGAPIVYSMLIDAADRAGRSLSERVKGLVAGAAPPTAMIEGAERTGFDISHVYGLTEVYGPASICVKQPEWEALSLEARARLNARQGVASMLQDAMLVLDPETLKPVPADGETVGEIMFRGNITMSGYLKNQTATDAAFAGGWFHTGDLAVTETDGYVRITDRSKDVIISGGENISSVEIEEVLHRHPAISLAAVVAKPDKRWGEVPCAFIELREGMKTDTAALTSFCREHLAGYKVPKHFVFGPIPKTATGKVQKFMLRDAAVAQG
ncbi:acyl-CoA synthetase [Sphingopyxis bauzanensis]|uniref:3-methylmercaptopropionyl-CoA ligase n=1 Tax=Sphingopyxis bauzanensis TaxID=651663 RepID=A0A246JR69_9SPHN|nr:acyl-CoA synthetase [Sphingopyxis bauzanensis]OWQ95468.1 acyl-CoA synthetase [Sphingopyxis bauzanensis]GGJ53220.1 acyl-CoA synthetase [Sphingopyxis bauzanensis]